MNCADAQLRIDDLVDAPRLGSGQGTLDGAAREAVEAHLATCAGCRRIVAETEAIRSAAAALEQYVPAPQVWGRIAAAVEADRQRPWWERQLAGLLGRRSLGVGGPQLAAAAVAIAI